MPSVTARWPEGAEAVLDLLAHQRACRSFTDDPVPDEDIEAMLEAAGRAPSAENRQPWVFVVVRDAEHRAAVWELAERAWKATGRAMAETTLEPAFLQNVDDGMTGGFGSAPVTVVVAVDGEKAGGAGAGSSIYPATQNLLIAAAALGYGSALTTMATVLADELAALLELPTGVRPMVIVPIGRPSRPLGRSRREPVGDHTHREVFGRAW